ncbi:MAG TPA: tryptophan 7-halogenase [Vicinamibacterales bacterium]|nr:tryptophan 7-halogenase [Vicinamibacterales bacterium]
MRGEERFDLVVIGGGPAGSTAATLVAMQGHRVLLLEKEAFPRYQIGESLLPLTIHAICAMLGVTDEIKQAGFVPKFGGVFRWGLREEPWHFTFGTVRDLAKAGAGYAYQVERARFDHILLNNARRRGVDVRERHAVLEPLFENERVSGVRFADPGGTERVARAAFVIDASGNGSPLHRHVGTRVYSEFFRNVALFCYYENAARLPGDQAGSVVSAAFDEGWFWFIPLSDTLTSVGAVIAREHAERLQQDHEQAMRGFIDACPFIRTLLAGATRVTDGPYGRFRVRKDYSYTNTHFWRPGLILIGDAACFIDPIFSSGVHLATYAALLAARSINTILRGGVDEPRALVEFERRYRAEFENVFGFLVSFYDVHQDEDSYFWRARKILHTTERANEAFVRLISGFSTAESTIFETASRVSAHMKEFERSGSREALCRIEELGRPNPRALRTPGSAAAAPAPETPRWPGGLITSPDGFYWTLPGHPVAR